MKVLVNPHQKYYISSPSGYAIKHLSDMEAKFSSCPPFYHCNYTCIIFLYLTECHGLEMSNFYQKKKKSVKAMKLNYEAKNAWCKPN